MVAEKGSLFGDATTGKIDWKLKMESSRRNACPLYADGKLYVPMLDDPAVKSDGGGEGRHDGRILYHQTGEKRRNPGACRFGWPLFRNSLGLQRQNLCADHPPFVLLRNEK